MPTSITLKRSHAPGQAAGGASTNAQAVAQRAAALWTPRVAGGVGDQIGGGTSGPEAGITYTAKVIPSSIDDTGTVNVAAEIQQWIQQQVVSGANAGNHVRVIPPSASSRYLFVGDFAADAMFHSYGKNHITFDGLGHWSGFPVTQTAPADAAQRAAVRSTYAAWSPTAHWVPGATIIRRGFGAQAWNSVFMTQGTDDTQVCGWTIDGENPNIGQVGVNGQLVNAAVLPNKSLPYENVCALQVRGGVTNYRFHDNRVIRWRGFGVLENNLGGAQPTGTKLYRNYIEGAEMGISPVDTAGHESRHNVIKHTSLIAFDLEGESTTVSISDVNIHHNIIDSWGVGWWYQTCWCIAANSANDALTKRIDRVSFTDNYVPVGQVRGAIGGTSQDKGGLAWRANKSNPKDDWTFDRNYTDWPDLQVSGGGRAYGYAAHFTDLNFRDNQIPMRGALQTLLGFVSDTTSASVPPTGVFNMTGNDIT